jgi:hypothetical protein
MTKLTQQTDLAAVVDRRDCRATRVMNDFQVGNTAVRQFDALDIDFDDAAFEVSLFCKQGHWKWAE